MPAPGPAFGEFSAPTFRLIGHGQDRAAIRAGPHGNEDANHLTADVGTRDGHAMKSRTDVEPVVVRDAPRLTTVTEIAVESVSVPESTPPE
jgi:hypothetical protein